MDADLPTCRELTLEGHAECIRMETSPTPEAECPQCEGSVRAPSLLSSWVGGLWTLRRWLEMGIRIDINQLTRDELTGLLWLDEAIEERREKRRRERDKENRRGRAGS